MKNTFNSINLAVYHHIAVLWTITIYEIALLWVKTIFGIIAMAITRGKTRDRIALWIDGEQDGMIARMEAKWASFESKVLS